MIYLIADTNFFIQYKKYDEVNFQDLFDDRYHEFTLLIPQTVISELDKHKKQGNDRVSRKARGITPLLREIIKEPIVKEIHNYKLTIDKLKRTKAAQDNVNDLDLSNPDEKIVNEVLNWKNHYPDEKMFFITGDIGMCSLCYDYDIQHIELPESWLLPPEQDKQKKELEKLRKEVQELKNKEPIIKIITNRSYRIKLSSFSKLNNSQLSMLSEKIQKKYPMKDMPIYEKEKTIIPSIYPLSIPLRGTINTRDYIEPTRNDWVTYNNDYTVWNESLTNRIIEINNQMIVNAELYDINFSLKNEGKVFAEDVIVSIETDADLLCAPYDDDIKELNNISQKEIIDVLNPLFPPKAPERIPRILIKPHELPVSDLSSFINGQNQNKEPFVFYYHPKRPKKFTKKIEFFCSKFRHNTEEHFGITFLIPYNFNEQVLKILITVSANNLESQEKYIIVKFDKEKINLSPIIEEIMHLNE